MSDTTRRGCSVRSRDQPRSGSAVPRQCRRGSTAAIGTSRPAVRHICPRPGRAYGVADGRVRARGSEESDERRSLLSAATRLIIGSEVSCNDGACGGLIRVVIDPNLPHAHQLVVEPKHRRGAGHLVPIDLVNSAARDIALHCTVARVWSLRSPVQCNIRQGIPESLELSSAVSQCCSPHPVSYFRSCHAIVAGWTATRSRPAPAFVAPRTQ